MTRGMVLNYISILVCLYVLNSVGTKNVSKEMQKISEGRVKDRGVTWFPELVDKRKDCFTLNIGTCTDRYVPLLGKSVKTHLYWAMKNCGTSPDTLRTLILNIPEHYKVCIISRTYIYTLRAHYYFTVSIQM